MEACGGSQHWARALQKLGHEVKLLSGRMVKPFVVGNKNDAADARGIWMAVQQPGIKAVAVKSEEQQAVLALHRMRKQLVKFRTAQSNGLRGLLHRSPTNAPSPAHAPKTCEHIRASIPQRSLCDSFAASSV
jgi:transposase